MPKVSDLTPDSYAFLLFLGKSGSGKTVAAGSFSSGLPEKKWGYNFDCDGRIRGIMDCPWIENKNRIEYDRYFPDDARGLDPIGEKLSVWQVAAATRSLQYEFAVLDSITNLARASMNEGLRLVTGRDGDTQGFDVRPGSKSVLPHVFPGPTHYRYEQLQVHGFFDICKKLPMHIIATCHLVDHYGKDPLDKNKYSPSVVTGEKLVLSNNLGETVQTYFDETYCFKKEERGSDIRFYVQFRGELAKTVYINLPKGWVDITNRNFYKTWRGLISGELVVESSQVKEKK